MTPTISEDGTWRLIWSIKGPLRGNLLLWQICRDALPTAGLLKDRHIIADDACFICGTRPETTLHAIRNCPGTLAAWKEVIHRQHWNLFVSSHETPTWLEHCLKINMYKHDTIEFWRFLFREIVLSTWFWRNREFNHDELHRPPRRVFISEAIRRARELRLARP